MLKRRLSALVAVAMVMPAVAAVIASPASADPLATLMSAVDATRTGSQCPPLQADPLVARAAQMATEQTKEYFGFRSPVVPFDDPMAALKTIGFPGTKAVLLSGFGPNSTDSIHGLMLQDQAKRVISDCAYTQYGLSAIEESGAGVFAAAVFAGP